MVFGAQGVIWLTLCKQTFMLKDYNQLCNAPCSFYTDITKIVHAVISTGNLHVLNHSFDQLQVSMHFSTVSHIGLLVLSAYCVIC